MERSRVIDLQIVSLFVHVKNDTCLFDVVLLCCVVHQFLSEREFH